jgi:XTP/dITP diphosphohydrolase
MRGTMDPLPGAPRLAAGMRVVLATHNAGKLREFQALFAPYGIELVSAGSLGLAEPEETESSFLGNARLKARAAAAASGLPSVADDSGFCLAALDGAPGIYSARWAGPGKDFAAAMAEVHSRLGAAEDHRAWFTCALCLAWPDGHTDTYIGRVSGTAVWPPRGSHGFGYDPMFLPEHMTQTFGEIDMVAKEAISHRARAFAQFAAARLPPL